MRLARVLLNFRLERCISSLQVLGVDRRQFILHVRGQLLVHVPSEPHGRDSLLTDAQHFVLLSLVEEHAEKLDGVLVRFVTCGRARILESLRQGKAGCVGKFHRTS